MGNWRPNANRWRQRSAQAAIGAREECGLKIPMIGLAKHREEIIISKSASFAGLNQPEILKKANIQKAMVRESGDFISITLPPNSPVVKLLQRIRDESHRFAVSYHSTLKR